ncbi:MAG: N-acetyltransferase [Atopobiaceae bacterium]|nr:N-acetyltransferase [Atopobiaceae bacterium]
MHIRHAEPSELDHIMGIYAHARAFMAAHGNERQWGPTNWPPRDLVAQDIATRKSYVCVTDDDKIAAVFFYDFGAGIDPCYDTIYDGSWLDDGPYGVVHRIASAGIERGAGTTCLEWALSQCGHLRIDTHGNNYVFQNLLRKLGFSQRGVIYVEEDDDPRLAFEKLAHL